MNTRNAKLWIYEERDRDVVPPFLIGEVAGSLSIAADRDQLRQFAESILDWLVQTEQSDNANVYRITPGNGTSG